MWTTPTMPWRFTLGFILIRCDSLECVRIRWASARGISWWCSEARSREVSFERIKLKYRIIKSAQISLRKAQCQHGNKRERCDSLRQRQPAAMLKRMERNEEVKKRLSIKKLNFVCDRSTRSRWWTSCGGRLAGLRQWIGAGTFDDKLLHLAVVLYSASSTQQVELADHGNWPTQVVQLPNQF